MNPLEFELELAKLKEKPLEEIPEQVKASMDMAYQMIRAESVKLTPVASKWPWLRRLMITTVCVCAACVLIISLVGVISPAMAQTLKHIPFVESVFGLAGDQGLKKANQQGVTAAVNQTVTYKGLTLSVSELMYDGSRLSLVLTRETSEDAEQSFLEWWHGDLESRVLTKGPVNNIDFYINGELVNTSWGLSPGGELAPNSVIVTTFESGKLHVPDEFEFTMVVTVPDLNQDFKFDIPVKKKAMGSKVLTPGEIKTHDHIHMKLGVIELSQTTTRLVVEIRGNPGEGIKEIEEAIPDKYKPSGYLNIDYELVDDQGRMPKSLGGSGVGEGELLSTTRIFEPLDSLPATITVKPYVPSGSQKIYISELEFTVPVQ